MNYANEHGKLTLAEMRVYKEAFGPKSLKEIARDLNLHRNTVAVHLCAIYRKLGCRDRLELIYRFKGVTL